MFDKDPLTAIEAIASAQWLAFAPLAFHATSVMRDRGLLSALARAEPATGCSVDEVAEITGLSVYAARVLLSAGLGLQILWRRDERYHLGKLGHFLLNDEMTRVNFDFSRDVCYGPAAHMDASLMEGRPAGLAELGPWSTIYEGLSALAEPATTSWHAFDHFYSSRAFDVVIEKFVYDTPKNLLDVGCNTGKWAELCLKRFASLEVGLVDLPLQLDKAHSRLRAAGLLDRASFYPLNVLESEVELPQSYEIIWMSQFLDCFSEEQIVAILGNARNALSVGGELWILELFWDRQEFEAAAFSLQQTSLYFSCVANGNSQMYESSVFLRLLDRAGLKIAKLTDGVGGYHTLLQCVAA